MHSVSELRKFAAPEFVFGVGARGLAGRYARNLGVRHALLVTDPGVIQAGWTSQIEQSLREAGLAVTVFSALTPNPKDYEVAAGLDLYQASGCDGLVAIGGGSPMDCAKGIGILCTNGGHILDYEGVDTLVSPCPPLICLPTTAGTAADISQFTIITDTNRRLKIAIVSKALIPDTSLIDPETTLTMDRDLTAFTGLDALVHAMEALASNASSPITDLHALEAIRLNTSNLIPTLNQLDDLTGRTNLALASLQAGLAFSNASLGLVHAMSHALGGLHHLQHGLCNAILLPHVMEYNFDAAEEAYEKASQAMGLELGTPGPARRQALLRAVRQLRSAAGVTHGLGDLGIKAADIPRLAGLAMADICTVTNPRIPTLNDIEELYGKAL